MFRAAVVENLVMVYMPKDSVERLRGMIAGGRLGNPMDFHPGEHFYVKVLAHNCFPDYSAMGLMPQGTMYLVSCEDDQHISVYDYSTPGAAEVALNKYIAPIIDELNKLL
jgi:hypothetical protein